MATRVKSVQYAWPMVVGPTTDATFTDLGTITAYLPDLTAAANIKSAFIEWSFRDRETVTTGGTIGEWRVELTVAAAVSTFTETDDFAETDEHLGGVVGPVDFTSHMVANWGAGTTQSLQARLYIDKTSGTTLTTCNLTAVITITYTYDDTAATQVKTVWLPLAGQVGALPTTQTTLDTMPALTGGSGLLPEASPVLRNVFVVLEANEGANNSATDFTVNVAVDGGAALVAAFHEQAMATDVFARWVVDLTSLDWTTTHTLDVWATVARCHNLVAHMVVTYEFTLAGTTRALNSVMLPMEFTSPLGGTTAADASYFEREFYVEEPGPITVRNCAFRLHWNENTSIGNLYLRAGDDTQTFGSAMATVGNAVAGMFVAQRRFDSSFTLTRGANTLMASAYRTGSEGSNYSGLLYINYESGIAAEGIGAHNHVVLFMLDPFNGALSDERIVPSFTPDLPETHRFITAISMLVCYWTNQSTGGITLDAELGPGEGKGDGWRNVYTDVQRTDPERACTLTWMRARPEFRRWTADPDPDRMTVETGRRWRFFTVTTSGQGMVLLIAYHSITYTVAGTVSGYSGDGSGITVDVFRAHNDEKVLELTTTTGGAFTGTWYDDTQDLYCVARQDDTRVGRSPDSLAV